MKPANDNHTGLRFLSVCSGIEAASVAWHPLGWKAVAFSEIEKFPSAVLKHHYPDVPNLGDFTKIDAKTLGRVDILAGGTPCQAFSVAGLRQSLADARGNLSLEFVRLAHELSANNGLRNVVWENVVGVLSTKDNAFGCFLAGLVGADSPIEPPRRAKWARHGMVSGPKGRAAWAVKDGQFFGVAQRRRRVLVVADFGNGADPAAVLFEPESMFRDTPPSREKGKDIAPTISARTKGGGGLGTDFDLDGGLVEASHPLLAKGNSSHDATKETYVPTWPAEVASTLNAAFGEKLGLENQHINSGAPLFVPSAVSVAGDIAHTLKGEGADANEDGTGRGTPIITCAPITPAMVSNGDRHTGFRDENGLVVETYVIRLVRRLTPVECERLQGFPDNYTDIPWRGKANSPDGPRYKALGNSWAVPKFIWLGERIQKLMPANDNSIELNQKRAA